MYKNFFKRLFDIIGALSAIPFVLLISLFVGLAIYIEDRGDIFYLACSIHIVSHKNVHN